MYFFWVVISWILYIQSLHTSHFSLGVVAFIVIAIQLINAKLHSLYGHKNSSCNKLFKELQEGNRDTNKLLSELLKKLSTEWEVEGTVKHLYVPPVFGILLDIISLVLIFALPYTSARLFLEIVTAIRLLILIIYTMGGYTYVREFNKLSPDKKIETKLIK